MADQKLLVLDPPQVVVFPGTLQAKETVPVKVSNPSENRVCFKFRTTDPQLYCVRPNSGLVEPGECTDVNISVIPFETKERTVARQRFQVLMAIVKDAIVCVDDVWDQLEPDEICQKRLKVSFTQEKSSSGGHTAQSDGQYACPAPAGTPSVFQGPARMGIDSVYVGIENDLRDELRLLRDDREEEATRQPRLSEMMYLASQHYHKPGMYIMVTCVIFIVGILIGALF